MNLHDFFMLHTMLDADKIHRQMHRQNEEANQLKWPKRKKCIDKTQNEPYSITYKESDRLIQSRENYHAMGTKPDIPKTRRKGLAFMEEETEKNYKKVSVFKFYHLMLTLFLPFGFLVIAFFVGLMLSS